MPTSAIEDEIRTILLHGFEKGYIDAKSNGNPALQPEFVINSREESVLSFIERELSLAESFDISVAFITQSGITPLLPVLKNLEKKHIHGRILTTDYLAFSEPKALDTLDSLCNITLRMYETSAGEGFHTKGYLFRHDGLYSILIGSANLTQYALTVNHEWNIKIVSTKEGEIAASVAQNFEDLWQHKKTKEYAEIRSSYAIRHTTCRRQQACSTKGHTTFLRGYRLTPNPMQEAFLDALKKALDSGSRKGLLISATGTGKTYASAFGLRDVLRPRRVLFIAHRRQILEQAKESYALVFGEDPDRMVGLSGDEKDFTAISKARFVFAMVSMLAKNEVLHRFKKDDFSTIVIDEVHHAVAPTYRALFDYFTPSFWLGMTATPDRTDRADVYALFDRTILYEIRLKDALENNLLCPFHYFGLKDIDTEGETENGVFDGRIFNRIHEEERVDHVLEQASYYGYSGTKLKGLIFCASIEEAKLLSKLFNKRKGPDGTLLRTIALSGEDSEEARQEAIERLRDNGDDALDYILTVNIFNEGVDIPEINQVILLRPTESAIVFVQQLGRGLRKHRDKEFLVVLDFIANYRGNFLIPIALSGDRTYKKDNMRKYVMEGSTIVPGVSTIHFDEVAKAAIFSAIDQSSTPKIFLKKHYFALKDKLGRIPSMLDWYRIGEIDPELFTTYQKGSYYSFVKNVDQNALPASLLPEQYTVLDYISTQVGDGKRPHELILLQMLIHNDTVQEQQYFEELKKDDIACTYADFESAIRILNKTFLNTENEKKRFSDITIIKSIGSSAYIAGESIFEAKDNQNDFFTFALNDIIQCGIEKYKDNYKNSDKNNLVLYQKYSRRDICRILNWEKDISSTIYGYKIKNDICPIFVTYKKNNNIPTATKYEDKFISNSVLRWFTKHDRRIDGKEVRHIAEHEERALSVLLFIKKSDDEGSEFYYLGPVRPTDGEETEILGDNGRMHPIVHFLLKLDRPVPFGLYDFLTR
ncbi:MAG: DEAD/DEAH box helicase [Desulfovibrio sp.]|nr:DEAD/DEAH box helicase [Desulfovibrio sp.]